MRIFGLLLLFSGWALVPAAIILLQAGVALQLFVIVAVAIELLGAALLTRFHMELQKGGR